MEEKITIKKLGNFGTTIQAVNQWKNMKKVVIHVVKYHHIHVSSNLAEMLKFKQCARCGVIEYFHDLQYQWSHYVLPDKLIRYMYDNIEIIDNDGRGEVYMQIRHVYIKCNMIPARMLVENRLQNVIHEGDNMYFIR